MQASEIDALASGDRVLIWGLRHWASRPSRSEPLPLAMVDGCRTLGDVQAAYAMDALFALLEWQLERPLDALCCCDRRLGADELALLALVAAQQDEELPPHGFDGPLGWALDRCVLSLAGLGYSCGRFASHGARRCPFNLATVH
jgi:hypothetical protein